MKCLWIALAAARMACAADFNLQEYLPPDTKVVMGVRVRALTESSLFKQSGDQAKAMGESWAKLTAFAGFDPLRDIDEMLLTSAADKENAPAMIVLRGRFHMDAGGPKYHGVAIKTDAKNKTSMLALLDENTALAGEAPLVKAAIDRRGGPVAFDRELVARVATLRERFDVWGTGERAEGFVAPGVQNDQLGSIDRFEFGLRITNGLELGGEVHARSRKDAEKLAASLALLQMMANAQSKEATFEVGLAEQTLKLRFAISEAELKKALAAQRANPARKAAPPKIIGGEVQSGPASNTTVFTLPGKR